MSTLQINPAIEAIVEKSYSQPVHPLHVQKAVWLKALQILKDPTEIAFVVKKIEELDFEIRRYDDWDALFAEAKLEDDFRPAYFEQWGDPIPYNDEEDFDLDPAYLSHRESSYGKLHQRRAKGHKRDGVRTARRETIKKEFFYG